MVHVSAAAAAAAAQVGLHNEVSGHWNGIYQRPRHNIQYGGSYGTGVERCAVGYVFG
jgi:hypothetical protein